MLELLGINFSKFLLWFLLFAIIYSVTLLIRYKFYQTVFQSAKLNGLN
jgi:hypothetical protein